MINYIIIGILSAVIGALLFFQHKDRQDHRRHIESLQEERQKLLDRIQAPSYDSLKHHEVKVIKAQKEDARDKTQLEVV